MKKTIFFSSCLLLVANSLFAQMYYTNQGTSNNIYPFGSTTTNNKVQWLYLSSDFNLPLPSGQITRVYFRTYSGSYSATYTNLNIRFTSTNLTGFPSTTAWVAGTVQVASLSSYTTGSLGAYTWYSVLLQTPYTYVGGDNLIVEIEHNGATGSVTNCCQAGPGTTTRRLWGNYGSTTPLSGATGSYGDIGFDFVTCQPPATLTTNSVTVNTAALSWAAVTGSMGYEYVLDQNPGNPAGAGTFTTGTVYNATGLNLNTTYYFHVRNICTNGYSPWLNGSFTTLNAYCLPPTNILFSNISKTSVDIMWSLMPTSDSYEYKVDLTPNPPLNASNTVGTTAIAAHIAGLQPGTKYYVFMRSICLGGADSSYWKRDSFITKFYCEAPDVAIAGYGTNNPTATWPVVPEAVAYEYTINSNSMLLPSFGTEIYTTSLNMTLDADGKDKYLHLRSKCNSQFTFSNWVTKELRTTPAGITNVNVEQTLEVYPNPATDMLTVEVKEASRKQAAIQLLDVTGKELINMGVKDDKTFIDISRLMPGLYILKYTNDNYISQKVISKN